MSNLLKIEQAEVSTKHDSQIKHVIRVQDDYCLIEWPDGSTTQTEPYALLKEVLECQDANVENAIRDHIDMGNSISVNGRLLHAEEVYSMMRQG